MGLLGKIKTEKLKETMVKGYDKGFDIIITLWKESYRGIIMYRVYSELTYNGELFDIIEYYVTYKRKKSERYFSMLESRYPEERRNRKVFLNRKETTI